MPTSARANARIAPNYLQRSGPYTKPSQTGEMMAWVPHIAHIDATYPGGIGCKKCRMGIVLDDPCSM